MSKGACFCSWAGLVVLVVLAPSYTNAAPRTPNGADVGPQPQARITQAIDENNLVTLRGNTRPEANARNDRGRVADGFAVEHVWLQLQRSSSQEHAVEKYIDQLNDKKSQNFHKWLTPKQFGDRYGVAQEDLDTVTDWLSSHGFVVNTVYPNHMLIDFSGNAGQVREAFHTELHELSVAGHTHIANMSDPQIPAALAPVVLG